MTSRISFLSFSCASNNSKLHHSPHLHPPRIWTFEDWFVLIPYFLGQNSFKCPTQANLFNGIFSFVINECCRIKQSHSLVFGAAVGWFACMHQTTLWNFSFYAICARNVPCTFGLLHVKIKTHAFFFTVFTLQLYITHPGKAHTPHPREGLLVHNMHFPQL